MLLKHALSFTAAVLAAGCIFTVTAGNAGSVKTVSGFKPIPPEREFHVEVITPGRNDTLGSKTAFKSVKEDCSVIQALPDYKGESLAIGLLD